jgi:hypothetical protein
LLLIMSSGKRRTGSSSFFASSTIGRDTTFTSGVGSLAFFGASIGPLQVISICDGWRIPRLPNHYRVYSVVPPLLLNDNNCDCWGHNYYHNSDGYTLAMLHSEWHKKLPITVPEPLLDWLESFSVLFTATLNCVCSSCTLNTVKWLQLQ